MKKIVVLAAMSFASLAHAEDSVFRFGAHVSGGTFRAHEIDGPSGSGTGASFGAIGVYNLDRGSRLYSTLSLSSYKTSATDVKVGQNGKDLEGTLSYQYMWRVSRGFRPWLGIGAGYLKSDYTDRHLRSASGQFSIPRPDASKNAPMGLLSVNIEPASDSENSSWTPGFQIQGGKAFSGKAAYLRAGVYFLY